MRHLVLLKSVLAVYVTGHGFGHASPCREWTLPADGDRVAAARILERLES